ncbi:GntR family transcriptional regulator [Amycolatopsis rhabdoformis]|uniref:GntR family transcriptional regulator n=1 Tax=Amycolatopsis rhabdoformis TaxID=1448059 RepID=A0ABZ1HZ85_9PSEU|nr:GntR family transcriptional regulator [Amycolatopsis rhabdoformis]WSE26882.1 GntR family transcriptional regulator [Amycolatopsis rhabdoformis]
MVDRSSGVPAYRQVAEDLREKIAVGEYAPGVQLPSERELVDAYGVSESTVHEAVNALQSEGLVTSEPGHGIVVRPSTIVLERVAAARLSRAAREQDGGAFRADAATRGLTPSAEVGVRFEPAVARVAARLAVPEGSEVTVRDRVMRVDGVVVQLAVSRLPRELTRGTAVENPDTGPGGTYARLEEAGHALGSFIEHVGARMPTPDEASLLQLADGVPVITVTRVAYGADGTP